MADEMVLAYHTVTRRKREVPEAWINDEVSPFPGQWRKAPSTVEKDGYETESVDKKDAETPELPESNVAGEGPGSKTPNPEQSPQVEARRQAINKKENS